ncbi:MAG: pyruvate kinase [Deltaproteobacteria bacterium]|nr:pyruvate kinase [Deltaproteobacteria bacterium]
MQNQFQMMRGLAGEFFGDDEKLVSVKGSTDLASCMENMLENTEAAGNPVLYAQTLAIVRHAASLTSNDISPEAQKPLLRLAQKYDRRVFGSGMVDAAAVLGPRPLGDRRARIVATMDPKATPSKVREMLLAGMNVARYNPAHATPAELKATMAMVRGEAAKLGKDVAIQIDLAGPKIRLGLFANPDKKELNDIFLKAGESVKITNADVLGNDKLFPIGFDGLKDVKPGERVFMNDGMVELLVKSVGKDKKGNAVLDVEVKKGGKVWDKKGVNLPDTDLKADAVTPEDLNVLGELLFHVDTVALSFVRGPEDVLKVREEMMLLGKVVPIIAKIERPEAMTNLSKIAVVADALMVARGDLGVEIGMENVPNAEREIARIGKRLGKPVMVATEVLKSMAKGSSRPTRGDVEGLYSAISGQGVDAIMLGKETSFLDHPGEVIAACSRVIEMAEEQLTMRNTKDDLDKPRAGSLMDVRLSR